MSKSLFRVTLAATACVFAASAQAQPKTEKALTYKMITAVATGAVDACQAMGYQVSVTVVGRNGEIVAQIKGDGAAPHTMENSRRKAYTALTFGSPSSTFAKQIADPKNDGARQRATLPGIIGIGGGIPIMSGKEVLGASASRARRARMMIAPRQASIASKDSSEPAESVRDYRDH